MVLWGIAGSYHPKWGIAGSYHPKKLRINRKSRLDSSVSIGDVHSVDQSNLAGVLQDLGELEEGKTLVALAHATFLRIFGPDHPRTKATLRRLDSFGGP